VVRAFAACATPKIAVAAKMMKGARVEQARERMVTSGGGEAAGGGEVVSLRVVSKR
jgi:hypothetical protein